MKLRIFVPLILSFLILLNGIFAQEVVPHPSVADKEKKGFDMADIVILGWFALIVIIILVLLGIRSYFMNKVIDQEIYGHYPTVYLF